MLCGLGRAKGLSGPQPPSAAGKGEASFAHTGQARARGSESGSSWESGRGADSISPHRDPSSGCPSENPTSHGETHPALVRGCSVFGGRSVFGSTVCSGRTPFDLWVCGGLLEASWGRTGLWRCRGRGPLSSRVSRETLRGRGPRWQSRPCPHASVSRLGVLHTRGLWGLTSWHGCERPASPRRDVLGGIAHAR